MSHVKSEFTNVTVAREANVYFDGKVTSRAITLADGQHKTLGVMLPGDYEFGTQAAEDMDISSGELEVLLPGSEVWQSITEPTLFHVPADSSFQVKVHSITNYCCSYLDA
ncbi:pyrimidine/purine nucleoside phosphorylase [Alphaproteobacteria bacterium]|nr:pyrimidine/purine nucleoside phosphorylase [Alphaproteobacteria bacterium]MDC0147412.1 pyrimidine/purine nucleoside phosphorylase [Alphaproteobacteria bacterium]